MTKTLDIKKRLRKKKRDENDNKPFEVRDAREKEFFIVDDAYLNGYARECGIYASSVYFVLCRHAGREQTCYPSIALMMDKLSLARASVVKGLKILEIHNIIKVDRQKGQPNIYTLLNKRHWKKKAIDIVGREYRRTRKNPNVIMTSEDE